MLATLISSTRRRSAITAFGLALAGVAGAATDANGQQPPRTITYEQAIDIALRQNPAVRRAENAVALQESNVTRQKFEFLPTLQLATQANQSVGRTFSAEEGSIVTSTTQSLNAGVSSSVTLFNGFRTVANLKSAQLGEDASEFDLVRTRQTAAMTVASNFLGLVAGEEQVRVRREALAAQEAELEQIRAFVDAGTRPIADLYQQQANVASARAALVDAERTLGNARIDLIETLQLDPRAEYEFAAPTIDVAANAAGAATLETLIARAVERRADVDALEAREAAAEQGIRAAASSRWPTVSLTAGYNTGASSAAGAPLLDQLDERQGFSVGIGVSIPISARLTARTAEQQAKIEADNATIALDQQRQQVALEVRRAWLDRASAEEQLRAAEARAEAAERALAATRERYRVGVATLLEVTQARAAQVEAASALVNARYTLVLQHTLIDYYVGDLDPRAAALG